MGEARAGREAPALHWARKYHSFGWAPLPVDRGRKSPSLPDWPSRRFTFEELPRWFTWQRNVALILGQASGGLVDVDCDCREAASIWRAIGLHTGAVYGRPTSPRSHYLYVTGSECKTKSRKFTDGPTCLIELRGDGHAATVPPSTHDTTGEAYTWHGDRPTAATEGDLQACVARVAALTLVSRNWPGRGSRHDLANSLAGFLCRLGFTQSEVEQYVVAAATAAGDEEARARGRAARQTCVTHKAGGDVFGLPNIARLCGADVAKRVSTWLGRTPSPSASCGRWAWEWFVREGARLVSPSAQAVLLQIRLHADPEGRSYPGVDTIAKGCKVHPNTLTRALHELGAAGLLTWRREGEKGRNTYQLHQFGDSQICTEAPPPPSQENHQISGLTPTTELSDKSGELPPAPPPSPTGTHDRTDPGDPDASTPTRACETCGATLAGRRPVARFCSGRCRVALHHLVNRPHRKEARTHALPSTFK